MGIVTVKAGQVVTPTAKRGVKAQGVVVTKTPKSLKLTDNGIVKLKFKVVSKTEMKQYKHPMYKPLLP